MKFVTNILLDLSFTRDYKMLLCMIGMMEKMLGFWGADGDQKV